MAKPKKGKPQLILNCWECGTELVDKKSFPQLVKGNQIIVILCHSCYRRAKHKGGFE